MVARAVPIASSAVGAILNYYFVRAWGRRAIKHFREKHLLERGLRTNQQPILLPPAP
jgi:membrane protein DedA with SNARE-associated domain